MNLECKSDMEARNRKIQLTVTTPVDRLYNVEIGETPNCMCEYHRNPRKIKPTCKHIVWVLLNKFGIHPSNAILNLVSLDMQNQILTSQGLKSKQYLKQNVRVLKNGMWTNY